LTTAPRGKIRLAYLSADFHTHATAFLMAGVFERHDRDRFETFAISFGPGDKSPMRARLMAAFDHFHDVASHSDDQVAQLIRELNVDIAVDLKGHTRDARPMILARRPAPIQIGYLGYPGTTGEGSGIDYILADSTVLPLDEQVHYSEKILHLPGCYQANDSKRIVGAPTSRTCENLPEAGFVFCCFNNNWKITAPIFDIWMRLLENVDGSVLWLMEDNASARANLTNAARAHGIDPARLIFAKHAPPMEHLSRHRLADLFLDTQPYGAHTGASDALWAGLPPVTLQGKSFPGRVAASLLKAVGLPELIAHDRTDYESLALSLALEPTRLAALRDRLHANVSTTGLFDTARFCADLEAQYIALARIAGAGNVSQT
jgi:predicted O-linked N-acetylglucosamine transferase (SPINDLY family)